MKAYKQLWLESKYLDKILKGKLEHLDSKLNEEIIKEEFKLGNAQFGDDIIYRVSEPGRITGINLCYARRLIVGEDFNDFENVQEEIDFYKEEYHSIFIKNRFMVKFKFLEGDKGKIKDLITTTNNEFNKNKRIIALSPKMLKEEIEIVFDRSPSIEHEIYFAYRILRNYVCKDL